MGNKQEREISKFTSQNNSDFTLAIMIDGLFLTIFATRVMYMDITRLVKLSMLIQHVFIFHRILLPFAFIKFASIKNSMCLFGL
jgi:hypothetical protein